MKTKKDIEIWLKKRLKEIDDNPFITHKVSIFNYPNYIPEAFVLKIQAVNHAMEMLQIISRYEEVTKNT